MNSNLSQDFQRAFNRALRYLGLRIRSKKELQGYLQKKKFDPQVISQVVDKLTEIKFLNDEEYAKSFFRTRQEYKGKSKYFIKYELKQKGVEADIIENISSTAQEDLRTAKDFIERKRRVYSRLSKLEFEQKMMGLLSSRGFNFDTIIKALKDEQ